MVDVGFFGIFYGSVGSSHANKSIPTQKIGYISLLYIDMYICIFVCIE